MAYKTLKFKLKRPNRRHSNSNLQYPWNDLNPKCLKIQFAFIEITYQYFVLTSQSLRQRKMPNSYAIKIKTNIYST